MNQHIYSIICIIQLFSCFFIGCILFRKDWPATGKWLIALVGITTLVESINTLFVAFLHQSTGWIYHYFLPVECGMLLYALYLASRHLIVRRWIIALLLFIPVIFISTMIRNPVFSRPDSYTVLYYFLLELLASLALLLETGIRKNDTPLLQRPVFWYATGVGIYSSLFMLLTTLLDLFLAKKQSMPHFFMWGSLIANTFEYCGIAAFFICLHRFSPVSVTA